MNCPVCDVTLVMMERTGVEIDYCPKCRGVWLDRGELDKLIERAAAASVVPPQRYETFERYERDDDDDDRDKWRGNDQDPRRRRREGFLGRIFDFD